VYTPPLIREDKILEVKDPYGFIYITTNLINGKKYIGQKKFDISNTWITYLGSGKHLKRAIIKYGKENFIREILSIAYSKEELNQLEIEYIKNHNATESNDYYNIASGGDGGNLILGKTDDEIKNIYNRISETRKGKYSGINSSWYGRHHTKESIEKIKNNHAILKSKNSYWFGKHMSDESKEKMSENKKGCIPWNKDIYGLFTGKDSFNKKSIVCINTKEIFNTEKEASLKYNIDYSSICACCNGRRKSCGKHPITSELLQWMYYSEYLKVGNDKKTYKNNHIKKVICITTNEIFNTTKEASEKYNINNIQNCCKGKQKSVGKLPDGTPLVWMYYDEYLQLHNEDQLAS
jgi:group I intron endonuclease